VHTSFIYDVALKRSSRMYCFKRSCWSLRLLNLFR